MSIIKPKYKKYDIIIKNHINNGRSYISPYDKTKITKYKVEKVEKSLKHYVYGFVNVYGFVYDSKIIDKEFDLYDKNYIRKEKLKKINNIINESNR